MKKLAQYIIVGLFIQLSLTPLRVYAEEVTISGNGANTSNTVTSSAPSSQSVQQTNTTTASNTVSVSSTTGKNDASNNANGSTAITTGNTTTTVSVDNQGNSSSLGQPCCQVSTSQSTISGNGSGSTNAIENSSGTSLSVSTVNTAHLTTLINGTSNTGGNIANGNTGNVHITTGNIAASDQITTGPLNSTSISLPSRNTGETQSIVSGNGDGSTNNINNTASRNATISVTNTANILNSVSWGLTTGGNEALGNVGNVDILTGDIITKSIIVNGPMNSSTIAMQWCVNTPGKTPPPPNESIGGPTTPSSGGGSGSSSSGSTLAASTGGILPVTGNAWLFFATIGNMILLILGVLVRLRSGRSPNLAFAL